MLADWISTLNWSPEQWLAVSIMIFVVLAIVVLVLRMITLFKMARKPAYKPNLRRLRRVRERNNEG